MTDHTPGPWRADVGSVYGDPDRDGWTAVALTPCPTSPPKSARRRQWEADARLIAAAPEMYEALRGLVEEFGGTIEQYGKLGPDYTFKDGTEVFEISTVLDRAPLIEAARQALSKASPSLLSEEGK